MVQDCNKGKVHQVLVVIIRKSSSQNVQGMNSYSGVSVIALTFWRRIVFKILAHSVLKM